MTKTRFDVVFLGGGLAATLAAFRLRQLQPQRRVLVLERDATLGGNHIWSFHETDLTTQQLQWIAPFIVRRWSHQEVIFPQHSRCLETRYQAITSEHLHKVAMRFLAGCVRVGTEVTSAGADYVILADGTQISANCVIDCRGALRDPVLDIAYQKFVGRMVETESPHGVLKPVIMDATVEQHDGYRFIYLLPFDEHRLLVEDTYYSENGILDANSVGCRIADYQATRGWGAARELRQEQGILPIALGGDIAAFWRNRRAESACAFAGVRAALFHPTTGYSLPDAVALADMLASFSSLETSAVRQLIETHSCRLWYKRSFFRVVNRMLLIAARPDERWRIMQRFYSLSAGLIERFYSDSLTRFDKARILIGRPPIPILRAARVVPEASLRWRPSILAAREQSST